MVCQCGAFVPSVKYISTPSPSYCSIITEMAGSGNNEYFQTTENWERWDNQLKILKENFPEPGNAYLVFETRLKITTENEG